ncbi:MAG: hypothetical protein K6F96_00675 [Bacteroidales bacterium]|nr:hypothetical protein [Bacteroidales bacterium]
MNRTLQYYNYSRCFSLYTERILDLRQAKIHGWVIVAKPNWPIAPLSPVY